MPDGYLPGLGSAVGHAVGEGMPISDPASNSARVNRSSALPARIEGLHMRFAIIGGGVIGLIYAATLTRAGHEVVVRSRGERARKLASEGVRMGEPHVEPLLFRPQLVEALSDDLDWILIAVKSEQVGAAVVPLLAAHRATPILTLSNAPHGLADLRARGQGRVFGGFPGVGGFFDSEGILRYVRIPDQPTTLEFDGSARVKSLKQVLDEAGFSTLFERRMDDWLKSHAVLICGIGGAVVRAGSCEALVADRRAIADMISSVCEGFRSLSMTGVSVLPFKLLLIFSRMPHFISEPFWTRKLATPAFTVGLAPHALGASTEMAAIAREVRVLLAPANNAMPHLAPTLTVLENRI